MYQRLHGPSRWFILCLRDWLVHVSQGGGGVGVESVQGERSLVANDWIGGLMLPGSDVSFYMLRVPYNSVTR